MPVPDEGPAFSFSYNLRNLSISYGDETLNLHRFHNGVETGKMKNRMNDIRCYLVGVMWTFLSLMAPIKDFMVAMMMLFGLNLLVGIVAARFNGEEWSWKKFGMFFVCCAIFFVTVASLFIIGHFLQSDTEALFCVKWVCIAATYLFTTNILKNMRRMLVEDSPWYKLVDFGYYALTLGFVEKFPAYKTYQEAKQLQTNGNKTGTTDDGDA